MSKIDIEVLNPNVEPNGEKIHRALRVGLGLVPVAGSALTEVFNSIFESPFERRRTEIIMQIGEVVNALTERNLVTEEMLKENEVFISTVAQACGVALRNHEVEKIEALRNAIRNSALPDQSVGDYSPMFVGFVDSCTVAHIKILHVFQDPKAWCFKNGHEFSDEKVRSMSDVFRLAFPSFDEQREFYGSVWGDLYRRGYAFNQDFYQKYDCDFLQSHLVTPLGKKLISFLS